MSGIGKDIVKATELLKAGKLVAIPTETVYGLAANALNSDAVASVFEAKKRPFFDPLIVHTHSIEKVNDFVTEFPAALENLAKAFWPGPLTVLLPRKQIIPDLVTAGLSRVAIRVPNHNLTLELLRQLDFPLAAPSANPFGYISPTKPEHVNKQLGDVVDYILDGGTCDVGIESTIVGIEENVICIYRLGGLSINEIEKIVGKVELKISDSSNPLVPGQLKSHYAPTKPLFIGDVKNLIKDHSGKKIGILDFGNSSEIFGKHFTINISKDGNLKEAAANLFSALRKLDEADVEIIICNYVSNSGLGPAINDRLNRASFR